MSTDTGKSSLPGQQNTPAGELQQRPRVEVVIEIPRGSFIKWRSSGGINFISPFPCLFNYGSVPTYYGLDGDLLDAVVLGSRLSRGTRITTTVQGAIGLSDHGDYDDKLICSDKPPGKFHIRAVVWFFHCYAVFKWVRNFLDGRRGRTACEGWSDGATAFSRAKPRPQRRF